MSPDRPLSLTKFLEKYMFRGKINFPDGESDFDLEIFTYDLNKGLFVGRSKG